MKIHRVHGFRENIKEIEMREEKKWAWVKRMGLGKRMIRNEIKNRRK